MNRGKDVKKNEDFQIKYSQNFLRSSLLVEELIRKSDIRPGDLVYEIGPGKGIITEQLANCGAEVIAIEKDKKLYNYLSRKFKDSKRIKIKYGDFLQFPLPKNIKYKIFSNIPFNLTADIITKLTTDSNPPLVSYLIIQKEAALKFAGSPYSKERQYSLLLKPWFQFKILYHFKPSDFYPVPRVNIVFLEIKKREKDLIDNDKAKLYRDFIVYSFNQCRPTLKQSLRKIFTYKQFKRLRKNLNFEEVAKPSDLSFQQWLGLFNYFLIGVEEFKKSLIRGSLQRLKQQQRKLQKIHRTRIEEDSN